MTLGLLAAGAGLLITGSFTVFLLFEGGIGDLGGRWWLTLLVLGALIIFLLQARRSRWFVRYPAGFFAIDAAVASFVLTYWSFGSGASPFQMTLTSSLPFAWNAVVYLWHKSRLSQ